MRIIEEEKKPLFFEEEKLTPKESKYRSAIKLQEAVECVERFEHAVASLESAQKLFEELGDYKDSAKRAEACAASSKEMQEQGLERAYQAAVQLQEAAKDKLEYRTVISEFERFPDYKDSAQRIEEAKKRIRRLGTITVWKNRAAALLMLAAVVAIFWNSPAKPYASGMVHLHQGQYRQALEDFGKCEKFLDSKWQKKKCRFCQAQKAYKAGDIDRALGLCLLARGRGDAEELMAELSIERMRDAKPGDTVLFGVEKISSREKRKEDNPSEPEEETDPAEEEETDMAIEAGGWYMVPWHVREREGDVLMLVNLEGNYRGIYDKESNDWQQSSLRKWLNRKLKNQLFSDSEKKLLQPVVHGDPERPDKVYILGKEDFIILPPKVMSHLTGNISFDGPIGASRLDGWESWLWDAGTDPDKVCAISSQKVVDDAHWVIDGDHIGYQALITEERDIYPVVKVSLDKELISGETGSPGPTPTEDIIMKPLP